MAYLKSDDFWKRYDIAIWEFVHIMNMLSEVKETQDKETQDFEKITSTIQDHRVRLAKKWPIANEDDMIENIKLSAPYRELLMWNNMIVTRVDWVLAKSLESIFN